MTLHEDIREYIPSRNNKRALIQKGPFEYNVVLKDGSLLFGNGEMPMYSDHTNVIDRVGGTQIVDSIIFGEEDRFVLLNEDLEIVAEDSSAEAIEKKLEERKSGRRKRAA